MADFGSPVAQNVNPTQGLQTLSGLLNVKSQQIGLQQQQRELQGTTADVQAKQQAMQERMAISQMMKSGVDDKGNSIKGPDGEPDPSRILPALGRIAPLTGQAYAQNILKSQSDRVGLEAASSSLDQQQRGMLMAPVQAAALDPTIKSADINAGIDNLVQAHPEMGNAATYLKGLVTHLDNVPQANRGQAVQTIASHMQPGQAVQTQPQGMNVDTGARVLQGTVAPPAAGGGFTPSSAVTREIAPGRQPFTDSFGRVFNFNPQSGNYQPAQSGGAGGATSSGSGKSSGPGASAPGDVEAIKNQTEANFQTVNANRRAASLAPQQLDQIDKALTLSQNTSTGGDWTANRARIESNLSSLIPGLGKAQDDASKVQELDKFLTRITADSNKVLGANASTDAERETISKQNASIGYTPQAVQNVLQYAKAQTLAMQAKGDAQENWLKKNGNGITNQHEFETTWRQAYDPVLFQLEAAKPQDRTKIVQNLPPEEAARLSSQRKALSDLGVVAP